MAFLRKDSARGGIPENNLITTNSDCSYRNTKSCDFLFSQFTIRSFCLIIASLELIVIDKIKAYIILSSPQMDLSLGMINTSLILY
jgi:hypothetical protein